MKTRILLASVTPVIVLALAACGGGSNDAADPGGRPTPSQEQPSGNVDIGDGESADLPDGWLESMQEYADCLNQNGAEGIKVNEAQGGLEMGSILPPDAVKKCLKYNPVYKEGGTKEMNP